MNIRCSSVWTTVILILSFIAIIGGTVGVLSSHSSGSIKNYPLIHTADGKIYKDGYVNDSGSQYPYVYHCYNGHLYIENSRTTFPTFDSKNQPEKCVINKKESE